MSWLARAEARLDRLGLALLQWWVWPAALLGVAVAVVATSLALTPTADAEQPVLLLGHPPTPPCPSLLATGQPCGQCGMTRSWLWAARGEWALAVRFNPAGFAAWLWLVLAGGLGALRLVRRDPALLRTPWWATGALAAAWIAVYAIGAGLRSGGWNPLP